MNLIRLVEGVVLVALLPACACAQESTPAEALDRYLARQSSGLSACSDSAVAVRIDASLPKLGKQGSMSGLKLVSRTGRIVYQGLRFTGDNLIKTKVIALFLSNDIKSSEQTSVAGITRENYSFVYQRTAEYNRSAAYVFQLVPRRRRPGLFRGELWLDPNTAEPLRVWGDFLKSPSIFIRGLRFVQDYQNLNQCVQPARLLLSVRTRIAGRAEMAVWLHSTDSPPEETGTEAGGPSAP